MNGKTIGRTKPEPDRTKVNESIAAHDDARMGIVNDKASPRERSFAAEAFRLKRELHAANERANAYSKGCDPRNPSRSVQTAFEREREFERLLMSFAELTPEARATAVDKLIADTKGYVERRDGFHREVEAELAKNRK